MPRSRNEEFELSIRSGRSMLRNAVEISEITHKTPTPLNTSVKVARIASIDARSEAVSIGNATTVIIDETLARWIYALCLARQTSGGKIWQIYLLQNYYILRLLGIGLPNEAKAFSERLRLETRRVPKDEAFDISDSRTKVADIEQFIIGHEIGHIAYRRGGNATEGLLQTVRVCADDLTRLLRATFTGDRSMLTENDNDPRYEDITHSVTDYLNRFIFHEYAEDIKKYERDLLARADVQTLMARQNRYAIFADVFETVDFIEEAFCDIYAVEYKLLRSRGSAEDPAEIVIEAWRYLHAMFALTALDSLARDRYLASVSCNEIAKVMQSADVLSMSDEQVNAIYDEINKIRSNGNSDRALIYYRIAMLKAIYRRVVFMNYITNHPTLASPKLIEQLENEGERLEGQFIGACSTLRFNGIRLEVENKAGFADEHKAPSRDDLNQLWHDIVVRVPGMAQICNQGVLPALASICISEPELACKCVFCDATKMARRLIVTNGRASLCDQCALGSVSIFEALPKGQPRRPSVEWGLLSPLPQELPKRAWPTSRHCYFCEIAPAPDEALVSRGTRYKICAICAEAAAQIVRRQSWASDPHRLETRKAEIEAMAKLVEESESAMLRTEMEGWVESARAKYEQEVSQPFRGRLVWHLFTEPTLPPNIQCDHSAPEIQQIGSCE